jgi:hypothetical protein
MGEQTDGRPDDRGLRFTDRGGRFGRRRFLRKAGIAAVAVGTGSLLAGCEFNHGPSQGSGTGQSSTSGQGSSDDQTNKGQGSSSSQSGMSG